MFQGKNIEQVETAVLYRLTLNNALFARTLRYGTTHKKTKILEAKRLLEDSIKFIDSYLAISNNFPIYAQRQNTRL